MRVLGVIDLMGGYAVHAVAGAREQYLPLHALAGRPIEPGSATALARWYVETLGLRELYVADLDAIQGRSSHQTQVAQLAAFGVPLWLDAGLSSTASVRDAQQRTAYRTIIALETLPAYEVLADVMTHVQTERVAFSLDLRGGRPLVTATMPADEPAETVAARVAALGVKVIFLIDLARVGAGTGLDLFLIDRVRRAAPNVALVAGGGIRTLGDIRQLANVGCDGVLIASALHTGRLGAADLAGVAAHDSRTL